MMKKYLPQLLVLTILCGMSSISMAAPSFDTANMVGHMKELVQRESRNELLKQAGDFVKSANALVAATNGVLKSIAQISGQSLTPVDEWIPVVPKSVAKLLEPEKPELEKVEAEIEKLLLIDRSGSEVLKQTTEQQKVMMLKILTYAYAAAERSLDLSGDAYKETQKLKEEIQKHDDVVTMMRQTAVLQMLSTRKMAEILHLHSRMLEVDSMVGIMKKERTQEEDNTSSAKGSDVTLPSSSLDTLNPGEGSSVPLPPSSLDAANKGVGYYTGGPFDANNPAEPKE